MSELDTLYDKEFIDSLPNFVRGRSNPFVVAIFKSPDEDVREIPNQIEAWYAELPANIRKDFYSRLRDKSKKSINFVSALAELYVHHWMLKDLQKLAKKASLALAAGMNWLNFFFLQFCRIYVILLYKKEV